MPASRLPSRRVISMVSSESPTPLTIKMPASRYCWPGRPDNGVTRYNEATRAHHSAQPRLLGDGIGPAHLAPLGSTRSCCHAFGPV
jgi:hypothetical protein